MVDPIQFRGAMARLPSGVCVITTSGPAGRGGFTASAVCSVTDSPPTLLVCMNRKSTQRSTFLENRTLCVNVLAAEHDEISAAFGRPSKETFDERFAEKCWTEGLHGLPSLEGAVARLFTRIVSTVEVGTHYVMFCEVDDIVSSDDAQGLIYFNREYCRPLPVSNKVFNTVAA
jgi:flavin reductase (DIM6/NTAB) family NADH-FMN oxidoreductase RutF